jgi:hypothetical protein
MGEKRPDHHDNEARETARKELELDITIPDYTEIVEATVGHSHEHRHGDDHGPPVDLHPLEPCAAEGGAMFGGETIAASG